LRVSLVGQMKSTDLNSEDKLPLALFKKLNF